MVESVHVVYYTYISNIYTDRIRYSNKNELPRVIAYKRLYFSVITCALTLKARVYASLIFVVVVRVCVRVILAVAMIAPLTTCSLPYLSPQEPCVSVLSILFLLNASCLRVDERDF